MPAEPGPAAALRTGTDDVPIERGAVNAQCAAHAARESHASDIPFQVATQLVRAAVGLPTLDDESVRARLRAGFDDADEQDLVLFEDLLGIRDSDIALPNIDPDARRRRLSALVKAAAIAAAS